MKELSLHILDIVQNSIKADSTKIRIYINENIKDNTLNIKIIDNGKGMDEETCKKAMDPFYTSRTTRKVGLGISLFKAAAELCDGYLKIDSKVGVGTKVSVLFKNNHIDKAPLGKLEDTIATLLMSSENVDYEYIHIYNDKSFKFDTLEVKRILDGVSIIEYDVVVWIKNFIKNGIKEIYV